METQDKSCSRQPSVETKEDGLSPKPKTLDRRGVINGAATSATAVLAMPHIAGAQAKMVKIGLPTILSGRVAQLGTSSRNAVMMEVEKINAQGDLAGRPTEMVIRNSKGQPQEAARLQQMGRVGA